MPKLLQINVTANWGSTGKIAEQIGICAIEHGWVSYIAYGRHFNSSKSHLIKIGSTIDTYLHFGEQRIRDNEGLCSRGATRKLIEQIKEIKPDIIHLHNIHDHYLNYQILFEYINKTDIKVVWTFHDCWAFTGHCFHFVTKSCVRWKTKCFSCPLIHDYPNTIMDRSSLNYELKKSLFTENKNLTVVACSKWLGDFVKESFLKGKQIEVVHNGIDIGTFHPIAKEGINQKFLILAVSNVWDEKKGLYDVYKLRNILPYDIYDIIMVGLSSKQVESLPRGIKGIQRTQNIQDLVQLYSDADVLINPTYADNFPTVNLEALACGTPVITYRTGGSPEAIDSKTGIVVDQGNVIALADSIMYLRENPLSSDDCRKRAEECFDKDKCFEKYIELYEELLSK